MHNDLPERSENLVERERVLFVTSRLSRADKVQSPIGGMDAKRQQELDWARRVGLDIRLFARSESGTETTCNTTVNVATTSGTTTENGGDVHTDTTQDSETRTIIDDMKNDSLA